MTPLIRMSVPGMYSCSEYCSKLALIICYFPEKVHQRIRTDQSVKCGKFRPPAPLRNNGLSENDSRDALPFQQIKFMPVNVKNSCTDKRPVLFTQ